MINFDRFPENKRKVLTMSYDDGKTYDRKLVEIFDKYEIRGTFHINGGYLSRLERIEPDEVKDLYKNHEISAHGLTHQSLSISPRENIVRQVMEDRLILEKLAGYPVRGMSYPNGLYNDIVVEILKATGIEYCRVVETHKNFSMPEDFLRWRGTCHHNENLLELGQKFLDQPYKNRPHLMYVWGHSIEFERDNNWDLIENFCKMMSGKEDIWYATNIEIVDYMKGLNNLKFSADCKMVYNPSAIRLWISVDEKPIILEPGKITLL
ncbi:MAG: polysaccharide deacetylase family protein [Clostridiales bacterium]|nr:polysaccharide deacetylase family protein [Clostridiales bacterium]